MSFDGKSAPTDLADDSQARLEKASVQEIIHQPIGSVANKIFYFPPF